MYPSASPGTYQVVTEQQDVSPGGSQVPTTPITSSAGAEPAPAAHTGVLRSFSWFLSWKSSEDVSRMVFRVWTMVEANLRSSSRSSMSAIEWKIFSAFRSRQSCLDKNQGGKDD